MYPVLGTLPAIFIMESMIDQVARTLNVDVDTVKKTNLYKDGQVWNQGYSGPHDMSLLIGHTYWSHFEGLSPGHHVGWCVNSRANSALHNVMFHVDLNKSANVANRKAEITSFNKVHNNDWAPASLPVCVSVYLPVCVCQSVSLSVCVCVCLSVHLPLSHRLTDG